MRILFTGGGTGGHFYPIVAIYRKIKEIVEQEQLLDAKMYYIGPDDFGMETLRKDQIEVVRIVSGKWRRYASFQNVIDIFKIIAGTVKAFFVLFRIMPDVIFSKGGYGSIPVVLVSAVYRIPLIVHESDSRPGLVNSFAARFADRVAISFDSARKYLPQKSAIALVGNPIRDAVLGGSRDAAQEEFAIFSSRPVVVIIGGSQGSQPINQAVIGVIRELATDFEILHQTGKENFEAVSGEASVILSKEERTYYHPIAFFDERNIRNAYAIADVVVSRAGAASIFEIAAVGKPAILIPLKGSAQEHQRENAYEYAEHGAADIIEEDNLTPSVLLNEIRKLAVDQERRKLMSERALQFAKPDAAEVIAREIFKIGIHN